MLTYYGIEGGLIDNIIGLILTAFVVAVIGLIGHIINGIIKKFKGD